jgi:hypothetical protein
MFRHKKEDDIKERIVKAPDSQLPGNSRDED